MLTAADAPQPLKDTAAAAFIEFSALVLPSSDFESISVEAKSRPPSCTRVLKNSPDFLMSMKFNI